MSKPKFRTTHPSRYYERQAQQQRQSVPIEYERESALERYGEILVAALGLLVIGMSLGMVVFGAVAGAFL